MANETRTRSGTRKAPAGTSAGDASKTASAKRKTAPRRPAQKTRRVRRRIVSEFKPDSQSISLSKMLYMTDVQKYRLLRWGLYIAVCVLCLVVQDCIMSQVSIFGTTTDLCVGALMIITVIEGSEVGSVFILIASCIYYFSGSAPGPYSVGMLSILGMLASLFRQQFWHRSSGSILFCSGLAVMLYEIGLYIVGMSMGLTRWYRFPRFVITGAMTVAVMIPLYHLINRIGLIGGNTWKE